MSSNRAVQAAQRRRAAPETRPPQPSINSSQVFSRQQTQQQPQQQPKEGITSINKMTIPQAITLITLRLGALETKMQSGEFQTCGTFDESSLNVDPRIIETILSRLDSLETQKPAQTTPINDMTLVKQIETLKQAIIQMKTQTNNLSKEQAILRNQNESLQKELSETREAINALQTITMQYSEKMLLEDLNEEELLKDETTDENEEELLENL
jgi:hypothetical protein